MTTLTSNLQDIVRFLEEYWYEKTGLIVALIVTMVTVTWLLIEAKVTGWLFITVLILSALFVWVAWLISKRTPKTPKNKIGFLVSIGCENDAESKKLRDDFLIPLRQLMKSGKTGNVFHFMELPQHLARTIIEHDDAQLLRLRSRLAYSS